MALIKVLVEQTGVEMAVPEEYYDKYAGSGLRHLGPVDKPKVTKATKSVTKDKED